MVRLLILAVMGLAALVLYWQVRTADLRQAVRALTAGRISEALPRLRSFVRRGDWVARTLRSYARLRLAQAYFLAGQFTAALEEVDRASAESDLRGLEPQAHQLRAAAYAGMDQLSEALAAANQALEAAERSQSRGFYETYALLAQIHLQKGNFTLAEQCAERCLELPNYQHSLAYRLLGEAARYRGRFEEAEQRYEQAFEHAAPWGGMRPELAEHNRAAAEVALATNALDQGRFADAAAYLEQALHRPTVAEPLKAAAHALLGHIYAHEGEEERAREQLALAEAVLQTLPEHRPLHALLRYCRGLAAAEAEHWEEAIGRLKEVVEACPHQIERPRWWCELGQVYERAGRVAEAQEAYQQAAAGYPELYAVQRAKERLAATSLSPPAQGEKEGGEDKT